jgi:hypothetical protein
MDSMRFLATCLALLTLGDAALASDVKPGDTVMAISDGIGCYNWDSYKGVLAIDNNDIPTLKGDLPEECLRVNAPMPFLVDSVNESSDAVCVRLGSWSPPPCFWFSLRKVRTMLSAGQSRV